MGEARRRAAAEKTAREEAFATGTPFKAPQACPRCGNQKVGFAKPDRPLASHDMCLHGVCPKCEAVWEAWPEMFIGSFDTAKMRTCSGYLRAVWALAAKAEKASK